MSKVNRKKTKFAPGIIAGNLTATAGKYTDEELLRRVTMANLLFEDTAYQRASDITNQMNALIPKVDPNFTLGLAQEIRFNHKLRHTPLYLIISVYKHFGALEGKVRETLTKVITRVDMMMDTLGMMEILLDNRTKAFRPVHGAIKRALADSFAKFDYYQLSKYQRNSNEISLIDVINLVHPVPTAKNAKFLEDAVKGKVTPPETWEVKLSTGGDKKETFEALIAEGKLGAMATLRNLRNMSQAGVPRSTIIQAINNVNSSMLMPLDFYKAAKILPEYTKFIDAAMQRSLTDVKIKGTTIICLDVSGSMGASLSGRSEFTREELGLSLLAYASYMFEDPIFVYTGSTHVKAEAVQGLSFLGDTKQRYKAGGGGIYTAQLTNWLVSQGLSKDAERLIVITDSQDMDRTYGSRAVPNTAPYKASYILDVSAHTHGIKTGNWTAEISGVTDALFKYIAAIESE